MENKGPHRHIKKFWPDRVYGIEIRITEEKLKGIIGKISYDYFLPGYSIVEVLKAWERRHLEFYYLDFTRSDLQEGIDILLSDGLLDQIGKFDNVIRYRFPSRLQLVLGQCTELNDDLFSVMIGIFQYLRSPTMPEKNS